MSWALLEDLNEIAIGLEKRGGWSFWKCKSFLKQLMQIVGAIDLVVNLLGVTSRKV